MGDDNVIHLFWWLNPGQRKFSGRVALDRVVVLTGPSSSGKSLALEAIAAALDDPGWLRGRPRSLPPGTIVVNDGPTSEDKGTQASPSQATLRVAFTDLGRGDGSWTGRRSGGTTKSENGNLTQGNRRRLGLPRALHAAAERVDLDSLVSHQVGELARYLGFDMDSADLPIEVEWLTGLLELRTRELLPEHVRAIGEPFIRPRRGTWHEGGPWARAYLRSAGPVRPGELVPSEEHGAGVRRWLQLAVGLALAEMDELFHGPLHPDHRRSDEVPVAVWSESQWRFVGADDHFWVGWGENEEGLPIEEEVTLAEVPALLECLEPWRRPLLLLDEPELHLHPVAQRQVAGWCRARVNELAGVIVATHSPAMMALPADVARHYHLDASGRAEEIGPAVLDYLDELGEEAGFGREAWFVSVAGLLLVEGQHDLDVVERFFGERLRRHRIHVIALRGGRSWKSMAESEFFAMAGIPLYFMFDNVRFGAVSDAESPADLREEERWAWQLSRLRDQGREIELVPYDDPDIMCGLPPGAFVRAFPHLQDPLARITDELASWERLVEKYRREDVARSFKSWVVHELGMTSTSGTEFVTRAIEKLAPADRPTATLSRAMNHLLATVSER